MSVLDSIIEGVREDLAARRLPMAQIAEAIDQVAPACDPLAILRTNEMSVIAEVKRSSPSKGVLARIADPAALAEQYVLAGATMISVLTERRRFGGSLDDLDAVRARVDTPILRKDFMVDAYQIYESRAIGADCVLLIVACLDDAQMQELEAIAHSLDMSVLVEVHDAQELQRALRLKTPLLGVNNRNLRTFEVSLDTTLSLMKEISKDKILITESGILQRGDVQRMRDAGVHAFLVGEAFMRAPDPGVAL